MTAASRTGTITISGTAGSTETEPVPTLSLETAETAREHVTVEEREVPERPIADSVDVPFQPATIRIPVRGEELVVERRTVVAREVVVTKERRELAA